MGMTASAFASWLEAYGRAWTSRDPQAAADLYTERGTYQVTPFVEPMRGRQAILDYWTHVTQTEQDIQFGYEILSVSPDQGIARWWASFVIVPPGLPTKLDGIFLISLDENGRCHSLREWWHKLQD
jgi:SnoaL-like domain